MSSKKYDSLSQLKKGRVDWKINVRVIRSWRGATKQGEPFKGFNVMLMDNKATRIQAFIPGNCADEHELKLRVGSVCSISNFIVQPYKPEDRFRCVHNDNQIIFCQETKIRDIQESKTTISNNAFDFYDHSELQQIINKNLYLTDVIGIIRNQECITLRDLVNKHGHKQFQAKFSITDGSSNLNVTFWDALAQKFYKALAEQVDDPVIIIITSCRVGSWKDQIDLSNVGATTFYLNYNHHSVKEIRKMLSHPDFSKQILATQRTKKTELLTIADIKNLGKEYIETEVIAHVNISYIEETNQWYFNECTGCKKEINIEHEVFMCLNCNRRLPHPEKKFKLTAVATDKTGAMEIVLDDREVRTLIGKRAYQLLEEVNDKLHFPKELKNLANKHVTVKLLIKELNIVTNATMYWATNICEGFYMPEEEKYQPTETMQQLTSQPLASTYHIDGMSL